MGKFIDLTRKRFGRLIVTGSSNKNKNEKTKWFCLCDCGKEKIVYSSNLIQNRTKSCGCLQRDMVTRQSTKHGHCGKGKGSQTYNPWAGIHQRCTNPNNQDYSNYGDRGITVCKRWMKFENFLEDIGEVPRGHQIDRINNNKGYYKNNCRWVTSKTNNRNRRNNHLETHGGRTQCISAWSEETGIPEYIIRKRLKLGWSVNKALTTQVGQYKRKNI